MVLRNPAIDAAVLEISHKGILCSGLGYDRADVAVITNVTGEGVSLPPLETVQELALLNAVVARATSNGGVTVLNADDGGCVRIAEEIQGKVYFSQHRDNKVIANHVRTGGRAVILRVESSRQEVRVIGAGDASILLTQRILSSPENRTQANMVPALAAAAACVGLDINPEHIRQGLYALVGGELK
jgi:cyanophycin synthetase